MAPGGQGPRAPYAGGFTTLGAEAGPVALTVRGEIPRWLAGSLLRNGPACFEAGARPLRHWFDGQAMLHRFGFQDGKVSYANKFLRTPSYLSIRDKGRLSYSEFATDPCRSLFARMFTRFRRRPNHNALVNIVPIGGRITAVTETPIPVEFDPATLDTVGLLDYDDDVAGQVTTAHPHEHPGSGDLVNYLVRFAGRSSYRIYRQARGELARRLVAEIPVGRPSYMHSFGITEDYAVLTEFPLLVDPKSLLLSGRPFIENYRWDPGRGLRFIVADLRDGSVRAKFRTDAAFAFHHVNSYQDGDELVVDMSCYDDADIISALYLDRLRTGATVPLPRLVRYRLPLSGGEVAREVIGDQALELPRIDHARNGRTYRHVYGAGAHAMDGNNFLDQLVKIDVDSGQSRIWWEPGCYPGEPVFVPSPTQEAEDDGVLLSVVFDSDSGGSFLLVLDAADLTELGRADAPHHIPFGFHGAYLSQAAVREEQQ